LQRIEEKYIGKRLNFSQKNGDVDLSDLNERLFRSFFAEKREIAPKCGSRRNIYDDVGERH
jgi:hypothetical protein